MDNILLMMLSAALNRGEENYGEIVDELNKRLSPYRDQEWITLVKKAKAHSVLCLLYDLLCDLENVPAYAKIECENAARNVCTNNYRFLVMDKQIIEGLQAENIKCCILKGIATSSYYPVPELRKSSDIDILITDREKAPAAVKVMEALGFTIEEEQFTNHHIVMSNSEGITLELHTMLAEPFDDAGINKFVEGLLPRCERHIRTKNVMGVDVPMLDTAFHAYELMLHMLQHFLYAGFGLKLLCDWVVIWNRFEKDGTERERRADDLIVRHERYIKLAEDTGVKHFSDVITAFCVKYLGLKYENVSWMETGDKKGYLEKPSGGLASSMKELMNEVLAAGEFGGDDGSRMVALRGSGLTAYVREFHHQTKLNYPKAAKVFLLWPGLWIATLVKFLKNNRTARNNASAKEYMKNAAQRGKLVKKLRIFEKKL
ncbi:MAG: nucleotidyltransferase family protein [Lachnospiraceae bacterium]|nr:nucleotidyltransferase family protein [Lachnospiraceae bacterium]